MKTESNVQFYRPFEEKIIKFIALVFISYILFVIAGAAYRLLKMEIIISIGVAFVYLIAFLCLPIGPHTKLRNLILDWGLGLLGFAIIIYTIIPALRIAEAGRFITFIPAYEYVFSVIAILLLLEIARRAAGKTFVAIIIFFLLYAFFGHMLPIAWTHKKLDLKWFLSFVYLGNIYYGATEGIFGRLSHIGITIIAGFLVFAAIMIAAGMGRFIINLFQSIAGWMSGGPAKVSIWASALFGTITGSPVAEVMAIGTITIPAMIGVGFERHIAAAIEAAAGCGGELMPPVMGAGAFLMAEMIGVPYLDIAKAAVIPAILYFATKFTAIHFYAKKKNLRGLPRHQLPKFTEVMKSGGHLLIPLVLLVYLLVVLPSIMWAAFWTIVATLIVANIVKSTRTRIRTLIDQLVDAAKSISSIVAIIIAADIASAVMAITGLGVSISKGMIAISGGNPLIALIIAMVGALILGMLVPATAAYIFAAVTFAGPLIELGFDVLPTHLFLFYFAIMGPITPPVALAAYAASSIAKSDFWKSGVWGTVFAVTGFIVPYIFMYAPELLLMGPPLDIVLRTSFVFLGTTSLAGVIFGYFFKSLNTFERVIIGISSILTLYPDTTYIMNTLGILIMLAFAAISIVRSRRITLRRI